MSYEPLHHKYRPQTFSDLVGQEAIATTLTNAIRSQRIAPAYLFTGSRGTGKTSSARILAKSLNCLKSNQPTEQPCGTCAVCLGIINGSALDVIEIDAASNTGVDNIRELIERAQFSPVQCRHKVYIIDEVHMLSTAAFNALLKTLEEPPDRVVFVLATTDPQRVLPTIISRCQRFDFRRIPLQAMVQHLKKIADIEKINITDEAITLVAQFAQGGLRDAESLLDQLSLLTEQVTIERVWDLVGAVPERDLLELLSAIDSHNAEAVLDKTRKLMDRGREPLIVLQNLAGFYRDLLIAKTAPNRNDLVAMTATTWNQLREVAKNIEIEIILAGQKHLKDSEIQVKNTTQPRLWLEVSLLGLLPLALKTNNSDRVIADTRSFTKSEDKKSNVIEFKPSTRDRSEPEREQTISIQANNHQNNSGAISEPLPPTEIKPKEQKLQDLAANVSAEKLESTPDLSQSVNVEEIWQQVLERLSISSKALFREHGRLLAINTYEARIGIRSPNLVKMAQSKLKDIEAAFLKALNRKVKVSIQVGEHLDSKSPLGQEPLNRFSGNGDTPIAPSYTSPKPEVEKVKETPERFNQSQSVSEVDELAIAAQRVAEFFKGEVTKIDAPVVTPKLQLERIVDKGLEEPEEDEEIDF